MVKRVLKDERGDLYDEQTVSSSMCAIMADKLETLEDGVAEMFTSPSRPEFRELVTALERYPLRKKVIPIVDAIRVAQEFDDESIFAGKRAFSSDKMAAMIEYLTATSHQIYKTSLNKLLFYADLTNFYLAGHGISGAVYYNRRFGPVADSAAPILTQLISEKSVKVDPRMQTLVSQDVPNSDELTDDERTVLDWVIENYGQMSAGEVSEYSHNEMAYKYTDPNEPIAYGYAQFLKKLPPKDLLGR